MEMSPIYDEDLIENGFFQHIRDYCPSLFQSAVENQWLICIPKLGTFESHVISEEDCLSHVLIQVSTSHYKTASDKNAEIVEKVIVLGAGFEERKNVRILFSETFYSSKQKKYQVLCIEEPLTFDCEPMSALPNTPSNVDYRINSIDDAVDLLFTGSGSMLKKRMDSLISSHRTALGVRDGKTQSLCHLVDTMHSLFTKCLQISLKDSQVKKKLSINRYSESSVKLAVETYITHSLYGTLLKHINTAEAHLDGELNKICRNLSQIQLKDLGITSEFSANIPKARKELATLTQLSTPLSKLSCIKRSVSMLMQTPRNSKDVEPLTVDDLLPMLVFLIIRSSIPNWNANFEYMNCFHFSKYASSNEDRFSLSTLEAALAYLRSADLKQESIEVFRPTTNSSKPSAINTLFEDIKHGDIDAIKSQLERVEKNNSKGGTLCHPLCSCDICEKEKASGQESRVTIFSRDDRGFTALHQAALYGKNEIIEYLHEQGCVVSATDYHGYTPLHLACQRGNQGATMMLVHCGADINAADNDGNTSLHLAALNGHEDCIKALVFQSAPNSLNVNAANENGDTALHLAAKWSYESITSFLLDIGASAEAINKNKFTPIMLASDGRIATLINQAIESAHEKANDGFFPVLQSVSPVIPAIPVIPDTTSNRLDFYPQKKEKVDTKVKKLLQAVADCDIEMVKHLMGWSESSGDSSESECETAGSMELCHPLCQCKKCTPMQKIQASLRDINSCDEQGYTALHIAVEKSNLDLVTLLLQKRADVNSKDFSVQFTPLHIACQQLDPNKEIIKLLIAHGAKVNSKDCQGRTPLHFSSQTGSLETTKLLLMAGANVHVLNHRGSSPLHEAAKVNNCDIVQLLLEFGANPEIMNKNGLRPSQITSETCIVKMLTEASEGKFKINENASKLYLTKKAQDRLVKEKQTERPSSLDRKIFAALEVGDADHLNRLLPSIDSFKQETLHHTTSRDLSSPSLGLQGVAEGISNNSSKADEADHQQEKECDYTSDLGSDHLSDLEPDMPSSSLLNDSEQHCSMSDHKHRIDRIYAVDEYLISKSSDSNSYIFLGRPGYDLDTSNAEPINVNNLLKP